MWKLKVLIQFVLAHIPFGERINHRLQRVNAVHKGGNDAVVRKRINDVGEGFRHLIALKPVDGATVVEVGTGWDALPTLMLYAAGARQIHTYDHVRHLRLDLAVASAAILADDLALAASFLGCSAATVRERLAPLVEDDPKDLSELLRRANIAYQAPGDATATGLPSGSVDLFYSFAVLEHVTERVADALVAEAKRVLKPNGVYYALVGLHDHYNFDPSVSDVNFLQYPESLWAFLVKNKISYHNRLRERDFLEMLSRHGATILQVVHTVRPEDVERVRRMKIDKRFANYTPEELAVTRTEIFAQWGPSEREP